MKWFYPKKVSFLFFLFLVFPLKEADANTQIAPKDFSVEETTTSVQNSSNNIIQSSDTTQMNSIDKNKTKENEFSSMTLSIQQEKAIQLKVNQELTSKMIEDAVIINNKLKDSTIEFIPEENLFQTTGEKKVRVKVIEKFDGDSKEIEEPITVSVERVQTITAEPNPQDLILGSDSSMWNKLDFVKLVSIDGKEVDKNGYVVDFVTVPETNTVHQSQVKLKLSDRWRTKSIFIDVPVNIVWGESILYQTNYSIAIERSAAAFTLHTNSNPIITSAIGLSNGTNNDSRVYAGYGILPQNLYYTFNWFDLSNVPSYLMTEEAKGTKYVEANAQDSVGMKLDAWGKNRQQTVHYGDVVRAWLAIPDWNWLYHDNQRALYNQGKNSVYYEITPTAYKPLKVNLASTKKQKISIGASDKEISNRIDQSIDLPEGVTARFVKFPPRTKLGDSYGVIRVSQKLSTGKTIEYEYSVPFEIVKDQMTVKFKEDASYILGQYTANFDYKNFIQEVKVGNKVLNKNEYDVAVLSQVESEIQYIGKNEIRLRVSSGQSTNTVESLVPVNVSWGQSIAFGGLEISSLPSSEARTTGAYTLQLNDKPQIVATPGNREGLNSRIHYYFTNEDYYKVDYFNMHTSRKIKDADKGDKSVTAQGQQYPREPVNQWGRTDVNYGDIIRSFGAEKGRHWVYEGDEQKQSFARKNNDYLYYEITKQGYSLLEINRLNTKKVKVPANSSKEYLDSIKTSFFTNLDSNKINIIGFSKYPDTSKPTSSGTLEVSEKLTTGKTITYSYEVTIGTTYTIMEQAVDEKNKPLSKEKITVLDSTDSYQPKPDKFLDNNGTVYKYFGYSYTNDSNSQQETIIGMPNQTFRSNTKIKYFYRNTDKLINVTLPTDLVFGTYNGSKKVTAKNYQIRNNSEELKTNVIFEKFEKVHSNVKLLSNTEKEPAKEENSAKLNLLIDNQPAIKGLNETTQSQGIKALAPQSTTTISIDGQYYGKMSEKNIMEYKTKLKFKALAD
ncbi:TPA: hypothetical protein RDU37_001594 [Enterococcus faecalis]|nr:hypothetical protein [Enterococcus faecalis]